MRHYLIGRFCLQPASLRSVDVLALASGLEQTWPPFFGLLHRILFVMFWLAEVAEATSSSSQEPSIILIIDHLCGAECCILLLFIAETMQAFLHWWLKHVRYKLAQFIWAQCHIYIYIRMCVSVDACQYPCVCKCRMFVYITISVYVSVFA